MQLIPELARLVAFPTVSNRPLVELAAYLAGRCEDAGLRVERFDDPSEDGKCSLIASVGPPGSGGLLLTGHMDVVPTAGQPWTSDPFVLTERDGQLVARGSADMKGFLAVVHQALDRIDPAEITRELVLIWTHDEEVGCRGSGALVDSLLARADRVQLPRPCLVGEPTGLRILRMHPGHTTAAIEVQGQAAHSSRPDLGVNAIEATARIIATCRQLAEQLRDERADLPEMERPWVALNVARIHGGTAVNIVPDHCFLELGYRPLPGQDATEVYGRLVRAIEDLQLTAVVRPRLVHATPALLTPPDTPLERLLLPHARDKRVGAATFATDGGQLARLGVQPLVFGPGAIEVAHQADEFVGRDELHQSVDIVESVIRARCCGVTE